MIERDAERKGQSRGEEGVFMVVEKAERLCAPYGIGQAGGSNTTTEIIIIEFVKSTPSRNINAIVFILGSSKHQVSQEGSCLVRYLYIINATMNALSMSHFLTKFIIAN